MDNSSINSFNISNTLTNGGSNATNVDTSFNYALNEPTKSELYIPFWSENPNIIFQQNYMFELFPIETMTYEQKLNSITRTVVLLTIISFVMTRNFRILIIGAITIGAVYLLYYYHQKEKNKIESKKIVDNIKENFESLGDGPAKAYFTDNNITIPENVFDNTTANNPFSNVLLTDYDYNPNKRPAPPSFNSNVNADILTQAKQFVTNANPDQPDIANKLFKDLGDNFVFEQSLRPFNSTPGTTIPNDQEAFADFCYGSMISSKEGNAFAAARNNSHYTLY
jgi:hypothetical protein